MADFIAGAVMSGKALKDILGAMLDAKVDAQAKEQVRAALDRLDQIQEGLSAARFKIADLQDALEEAKAKLAEVESWQSRLSKLTQVKTAYGSTVFKDPTTDSYVCPSCINKREIQFLQPSTRTRGAYLCKGCEASYQLEARSESNTQPAMYASRNPWGR